MIWHCCLIDQRFISEFDKRMKERQILSEIVNLELVFCICFGFAARADGPQQQLHGRVERLLLDVTAVYRLVYLVCIQ